MSREFDAESSSYQTASSAIQFVPQPCSGLDGDGSENLSAVSNDEFWSQSQSRISVVWSRVGTGKRGCHIAGGLAFLRRLRRGRDSREGSSVTQRVSISLQGLRPVTRSARPVSPAGLQRHACVTTHGFP